MNKVLRRHTRISFGKRLSALLLAGSMLCLNGCWTGRDRAAVSVESAAGTSGLTRNSVTDSVMVSSVRRADGRMAKSVTAFLSASATVTQLRADLVANHNLKFPPRWYYMGSDTRNHYAIGFFFLQPRRFYRIARSECGVPSEFALTANDAFWLEFNRLEKRGGQQLRHRFRHAVPVCPMAAHERG